MSIHVALRHVTQYRYDRAVALSPQLVRLRPAPHCRTPILSYSQRITPSGHFLNWQQDPQSNYVARLDVSREGRRVPRRGRPRGRDGRLQSVRLLPRAVRRTLSVLLRGVGSCASCSRFCAPSRSRRVWPAISDAIDRAAGGGPSTSWSTSTASCSSDIRYVIRLDPGVQDVERTLELASGSCRDTTWLLVQLFRHLGLAARFVSGYLIQLIAGREGARRTGRRRPRLHRSPRLVRGLPAGRRLDRPRSDVGTARGRRAHPAGVHARADERRAGHRAASNQCEVEFDHEMSVQRIVESPRVTKPYTDAQWEAILALRPRGRRATSPPATCA